MAFWINVHGRQLHPKIAIYIVKQLKNDSYRLGLYWKLGWGTLGLFYFVTYTWHQMAFDEPNLLMCTLSLFQNIRLEYFLIPNQLSKKKILGQQRHLAILELNFLPLLPSSLSSWYKALCILLNSISVQNHCQLPKTVASLINTLS